MVVWRTYSALLPSSRKLEFISEEREEKEQEGGGRGIIYSAAGKENMRTPFLSRRPALFLLLVFIISTVIPVVGAIVTKSLRAQPQVVTTGRFQCNHEFAQVNDFSRQIESCCYYHSLYRCPRHRSQSSATISLHKKTTSVDRVESRYYHSHRCPRHWRHSSATVSLHKRTTAVDRLKVGVTITVFIVVLVIGVTLAQP